MACNHSNTQRLNEVKVCLQCGMTVMPDGKIFFDRKIINYKPKKKRKGVK